MPRGKRGGKKKGKGGVVDPPPTNLFHSSFNCKVFVVPSQEMPERKERRREGKREEGPSSNPLSRFGSLNPKKSELVGEGREGESPRPPPEFSMPPV